MKIIFLNAWFGMAEKPMREYIMKQAESTDIFCFSEVSSGDPDLSFGKLTGFKPVGKEFEHLVTKFCSNLYFKFQKMLPYFDGRFDSTCELSTEDGKSFQIGLAYFVKKDIKIVSSDVAEVNKDTEDNPEGYERIMQYFCVEQGGRKFWINNIHGLAQPGHKLDTPNRILQSENICRELEKQSGAKILGGDFNLMPDIESIKIIERFGMQNLIKDFNIQNTRSEISHSQYPGREKQHFADFAFVSNDVKVKKFSVPRINISDHLPLEITIE